MRSGIPWLVVLALALSPRLAAAQGHWEWPEKAENLKVLPPDTPPERLRAVMVGFARSLGVRCVHCHVGEKDAGLADLDFRSDENPNKDTARLMLKMVGTINDEWISKIPTEEGEPRVTVQCLTCHRGLPRPVTLEKTLSEVYASEGIDATIARYRELREKLYGAGSYDFREGSLNALGYDLLQAGHTEDAIAVFKLNTEQFPDSGNVWDSLGEAWLTAGDRDQAISCYEKAVELDPRNRNAAAQLEKLRAGE